MVFVWRVQLLLFAITCMLVRVDAMDTMDLHRKIQYHFSELKKSLYDLKTTRLHKRSASPDYDEIIYRSLESFCYQLNPIKNPSCSKTKPSTSPGNSAVKTPILANSRGPEIFPIRIEAERYSDSVSLVFSIIHSVPGFMFRVNSLDYSKIPIDFPYESSNPRETKVVLNVTSSRCKEENEQSINKMEPAFAIMSNEQSINKMGPAFAIMSQNNKDENLMTLDICHFDEFWPNSKYSEQLEPPEFKMSSDPRNEVIIQNGQNATIYVDIKLFSRHHISIRTKIWDREEGEILEGFARADIYNFGPHDGRIHIKNDEDNLLLVEVVEETLVNLTKPDVSHQNNDNGDDGDDYSRIYINGVDVTKSYIKAKFKIMVNTANGKRSGRVTFGIHQSYPISLTRLLVSDLATFRVVKLRLQNRRRVFPRNTVRITTRTFECDENGIKNEMRESRNCTLSCFAFGTDIKSIALRKNHPYRAPVKSVSYLVGKFAFAMVDMGPVSDVIEGTYRCVVQTKNGKRTRQDLELHTKLFTNITELSVIKLNNDTSEITCSVSGAPPVEISLFLDDGNWNRKRLANNETTGAGSEFESQVTIQVPSIELSHPMDHVFCLAEGPRGVATGTVYPSDVTHSSYTVSCSNEQGSEGSSRTLSLGDIMLHASFSFFPCGFKQSRNFWLEMTI